MSFDLDDIIIDWKVKYGEKRTSKQYGTEYYAVPKGKERQESIRHLVQSIKNKGKDKFFFKQNSVKNTIAAACFPPIVYDKESRDRGYKTVFRELAEVVAEFWPDSDVQEATENTHKVEPQSDYDPSIHESPFKKLDRSTLKDMPAPEVVFDEEASKILGFDNE